MTYSATFSPLEVVQLSALVSAPAIDPSTELPAEHGSSATYPDRMAGLCRPSDVPTPAIGDHSCPSHDPCPAAAGKVPGPAMGSDPCAVLPPSDSGIPAPIPPRTMCTAIIFLLGRVNATGWCPQNQPAVSNIRLGLPFAICCELFCFLWDPVSETPSDLLELFNSLSHSIFSVLFSFQSPLCAFINVELQLLCTWCSKHLRCTRAATKLQTVWRMVRCVRWYQHQRQAIVQLQAIVWGRQERQRYLQGRSAVIRIQSLQRMRMCRATYGRQGTVLRRLQATVRAQQQRRRFLELRGSAICLQSLWRRVVATGLTHQHVFPTLNPFTWFAQIPSLNLTLRFTKPGFHSFFHCLESIIDQDHEGPKI